MKKILFFTLVIFIAVLPNKLLAQQLNISGLTPQKNVDITTNNPPTSDYAYLNVNDGVEYFFDGTEFPYFDIDGDPMFGVEISQLPSLGTLFFEGMPITEPYYFINIADIFMLSFYASVGVINSPKEIDFLEFIVFDGTNFSVDNYIMEINIEEENIMPQTSDYDVFMEMNNSYVFHKNNFPFYDENFDDTLVAIQIIGNVADGSFWLDYDHSGFIDNDEIPVNIDDFIDVNDLSYLTYTPPMDAQGSPYDVFQFLVFDGTDFSEFSGTINLYVMEEPVANAGADITTCDGTANLYATSTGYWTLINGFGEFMDMYDPNTTFFNVSPGVNTIRWSSDMNVSYDDIDVVNNMVVANAGFDISTCSEVMTLNAIDPILEYPYQGIGTWTNMSGGGLTFEDENNPQTMVYNYASGNYMLEWSVRKGQCVATDVITFTADILTVDAGEDQVVYADSAQLQAYPISPDATGNWYVYSGPAFFQDPYNDTTMVYNLLPGTNTLTWLVSKAGCATITDSVVIFYSESYANAGSDQIICDNYTYFDALDPAPFVGTWTINAGTGIIQDINDPNSFVSELGGGLNKFVWTVDNGETVEQDTVSIFNYAVSAYAGEDIIIISEDYPLPPISVPLNAQFSSEQTLWSCDNQSVIFDDPISNVTNANNIAGGLTTLVWTVYNTYCSATDSLNIIYANSIQSANNGVWDDPSTWSPPVIPTEFDSVTISGDSVTIVAFDAYCKSLRVQNGGNLTIFEADGSIGSLTCNYLYIESDAKAVANVNVRHGGNLVIEQEIENKANHPSGVIIGSGGNLVIEQEIERDTNIAYLSTPNIYLGTTDIGAPITDANMYVGNGANVILQNPNTPPLFAVTGGGTLVIEQEIENKSLKGPANVTVKHGGNLVIEQEIENKGSDPTVVIHGGNLVIEQEIENKGFRSANGVIIGHGGNLVIEQEIERFTFDNSYFSAPLIHIKSGTMIVGDSIPAKLSTSVIHGGNLVIEQVIERRSNGTPNLLVRSATIELEPDTNATTLIEVFENASVTLSDNSFISTTSNLPLVYAHDGSSVVDLRDTSEYLIMTSKNMYQNQSNAFSSPISDLNASTFNFGDFYFWEEISWGQLNQDETLTTLKGYLFNSTTDSSVVFDGYQNSNSQSIDLHNNIALEPSYRGWNFVGNPYLSTIDFEMINLNDVENTFYVFDDSLQNFKIYQQGGISLNGGDQYINSAKPFFVKANLNAVNPIFTVDQLVKMHKIEGLYNPVQPKSISDNLLLTVTGNNFSDQTLIYMDDFSTDGFDANIDAFKLMSLNTDVPQMYTVDDFNNNLSINTFPAVEIGFEKTVDLNFVSDADGTYEINVSEIGIPDNILVSLYDNLTGSNVDLRTTPTYSFDHSFGNDINRFDLIFNSLGDIEQIDNSNVKIYSYKNVVYVNLQEDVKAKVDVFNKLGVKIKTVELNGKGDHNFAVENITDYVVVSVQTDKEYVTKTVLITN